MLRHVRLLCKSKTLLFKPKMLHRIVAYDSDVEFDIDASIEIKDSEIVGLYDYNQPFDEFLMHSELTNLTNGVDKLNFESLIKNLYLTNTACVRILFRDKFYCASITV